MENFNCEPSWMRAAKQDVQLSEEWMQFTKTLFDLVTVEMEESGIVSFAVLTEVEKKRFVTKAVNSIKSENIYNDLFATLSKRLDYQFGLEIKRQFALNCHLALSDQISEELHNTVETILARWPDTKMNFVRCINTFLSPRLRYAMWCAQLQSPEVKQKYLSMAKTSPKSMVSKQDMEIAQKCQALLESNSTLSALSELNGSISVLRHILSYHQVLMKTENNLPDTDYLLAVPFVYCSLSAIKSLKTKHKTVSAETLVTIVEQYELFWSNRPALTRNIDNGSRLVKFSLSVLSILNSIDEELSTTLGNVYSTSFHKKESDSVIAIKTLLEPCLRCYFVTYLPLDCVMFIFDQIFLGLFIETYDPLPALSATLVYLSLNKIDEFSSWQQVEVCFRKQLHQLSVESLQGTLADKNLANTLQATVGSNFPQDKINFDAPHLVCSLPPWKHWSSGELVEHFKTHSKKKSHFASSTTFAEQYEAASVEGRRSLVDVESERDNLIKEMELMSLELKESRKELVNERMAKAELEKQADFEIDQLKRKIEYLQKSDRLTPPALLISSALQFGLTDPEYEESESSTPFRLLPLPPAGSPVQEVSAKPSVAVSPEPEVEDQNLEIPVVEVDGLPEETETPTVKGNFIIRDVIGGMMQGVNDIAHGVGQEREKLNTMTKLDLAATKKIYEQVKMKVLGKAITEEELQKLPAEQYQKVLLKISDSMRTQLMKLKTKY